MKVLKILGIVLIALMSISLTYANTSTNTTSYDEVSEKYTFLQLNLEDDFTVFLLLLLLVVGGFVMAYFSLSIGGLIYIAIALLLYVNGYSPVLSFIVFILGLIGLYQSTQVKG